MDRDDVHRRWLNNAIRVMWTCGVDVPFHLLTGGLSRGFVPTYQGTQPDWLS